MSGFLNSLTDLYRERLRRHRNLPFLRGVMAASALVAVADGSVSLGQRMRMDSVMETLEKLQVFDPHEGVDLFNQFVEAIRTSPQTGREAAIQAVRDVAKDQETKQLMLRVCLAISETNGKISMVDQIEIVSLCSLLDIEPKACGLYTDAERPI